MTDATERPVISVVVPFFNSQRHVRACLESLSAQASVAGRYEVIVVDNGSSDASPSIVSEFRGMTMLTETAPGAYAARNTGIRVAAAPVIAFTDADCVVGPDWIRAIGEAMSEPTTGIVIGQCRYPQDASFALKLLGAYENAKADYVTTRAAPAQRFAYANNMAVRASVFREIGMFEEWPRAADTELVHRLAARRPDLRLIFSDMMRVTHHEFTSARARTTRLSLYTRTNAQVASFRELSLFDRLRVLGWLFRRRRRRTLPGSPDLERHLG